jgi:hypothetical protein
MSDSTTRTLEPAHTMLAHRTVVRIGESIVVEVSQSPKNKSIVITVNAPSDVAVTVSEQ